MLTNKYIPNNSLWQDVLRMGITDASIFFNEYKDKRNRLKCKIKISGRLRRSVFVALPSYVVEFINLETKEINLHTHNYQDKINLS